MTDYKVDPGTLQMPVRFRNEPDAPHDLDTLGASLASEGQEFPVLISQSGLVLEGQRRVLAAQRVGRHVIVREINHLDELLTEMAKQLDGMYAIPKMYDEIGRQAAVINNWDAPNVAARKSAQAKRGWATRSGEEDKAAKGRGYAGWPEAFGISTTTYSRIWQIQRRIGNPQFTEEQQNTARAALARASEGKGLYAAHLVATAPILHIPNQGGSPQYDVLSKALAQIKGVLDALSGIKVDPKLDPKDRRAFRKQIREQRTALYRLYAKLDPEGKKNA